MDDNEDYGYDDDYGDVADEYKDEDDDVNVNLAYQPVPDLKAQVRRKNNLTYD